MTVKQGQFANYAKQVWATQVCINRFFFKLILLVYLYKIN